MTNSNQKGKRGERQWRDHLRNHGFLQAYRGQQYCGSADSADVMCPELPRIHFEVKNCERLNLYDAMTQAHNDSVGVYPYKIPVVAHTKNNCEWLVTMRAEDWLNMIKETDHVKLDRPLCKECWSDKNLIKHGIGYKGKQRYLCKQCGNSFFGDYVNGRQTNKVQTMSRNA